MTVLRAVAAFALVLLAGCHQQVNVDLYSDDPRLEERILRDPRRLALKVNSDLRSLGESHTFFFELPLIAYSSHTNWVTDPGQARNYYFDALQEDLTAAGFEVVSWRDKSATHRLRVDLGTFDYFHSFFFAVFWPSIDHRSALLGAEAVLETPDATYARSFKTFDVADEDKLDVDEQMAYVWRHNARDVALETARQCYSEELDGPPEATGVHRSDSQRTPPSTAWTAVELNWTEEESTR